MNSKIFIFGLGNPGDGFRLNRHNVGHQFLDFLRIKMGLDRFVEKKKLKACVSSNDKLFLAKNSTYMNLSGEAVINTLNFYLDGGFKADKISTGEQIESDRASDQKNDSTDLKSRLIVVHDDLDLTVGNFKIQHGVGPKQHNGLLSIYRNLGTSSFWHVRIGVDGREGSRLIPPDRYVLQNFSSEEKAALKGTFAQALKRMLSSGLLSNK
jgi:peptidyl-tRNA hydrolase, PTH1 family